MADFFESLKGNLENLGKTISETAEVVSKKTEEAVEIQKMKSQIRGLERSNQRDFQDIGKIIYERFKKGEVVDTAFIELCETIEGREEQIQDYRRQVAEIKGMDVCPSCKEHVEPGAVYCPKCGAKIDEDIFEAEDEEVEAEEVNEDVEAEFEE